MAVRFPKKNNPYYPLPPDFPSLDSMGQRKARINALLLQENPEDLVHAWRFFREHYLLPEETGWYKRFLPSPKMHYMIPYELGKFSRNAWAATRSFAKTTVIREMAMLFLLTRKHFSTALIQATEKKYKKSMGYIKRQFVHNPYIQDDFGWLYGSLKPKRGERTWNTDLIELPHGSVIEGLSVNGALRGERPDLLLVDDPEYDEEETDDGVRKSKLIEDFEKLLFKVLLGMLDDGAAIFWIGTLISRQSFLYHICNSEEERFQSWNRRILSALMPDGSLLWEAKWDHQALRDKRLSLGESAFNSEMMNSPGSPSDRILKIHPDLCTYRVEGPPPHLHDPITSDATLVYSEGIKEGDSVVCHPKRARYGDWIQGLYRLMCVDYAPTVKVSSDYSCLAIMGLDKEDTLWVLDLFVAKVREDALIRMIWEKACQWQVRSIGVEAVAIQKHLVDRVQAEMARRGGGSRFRVLPLRYPAKLSKAERISGLEWRFNQYRIRLPAHRIVEPSVGQLFYQVENFTPDLSMLRHDDIIDTIAMQQYMLKRQGTAYQQRAPNLKTPLDMLRAGELFNPVTGLRNTSGLDISEIPRDVLGHLRKLHYDTLGVPVEEEENIVSWNMQSPFSVYQA